MITSTLRKWSRALAFLSPTSSTHHSRKVLNSSSRFASEIIQCFLIYALSSAKSSSMRLQSDEYEVRNITLTLARAHKVSIFGLRWNDALFIIITDRFLKKRLQCESNYFMNFRKKTASVDPWNIRKKRISSWSYADKIWYRCSRWNYAIFFSVTSRDDHSRRRKSILLSHSDSST